MRGQYPGHVITLDQSEAPESGLTLKCTQPLCRRRCHERAPRPGSFITAISRNWNIVRERHKEDTGEQNLHLDLHDRFNNP